MKHVAWKSVGKYICWFHVFLTFALFATWKRNGYASEKEVRTSGLDILQINQCNINELWNFNKSWISIEIRTCLCFDWIKHFCHTYLCFVRKLEHGFITIMVISPLKLYKFHENSIIHQVVFVWFFFKGFACMGRLIEPLQHLGN